MTLPCPALPRGTLSCSRDPVSITTPPRLLTLLLTLTVPSVSHLLPPAAVALRQVLPTTAALKACSEPRRSSHCCSSEVAHWEPQSCLSLGFGHHSQNNCAGGSRAGANGAALCSCLDQPLDLAAGGGVAAAAGIRPPPHPTPSVDSIS